MLQVKCALQVSTQGRKAAKSIQASGFILDQEFLSGLRITNCCEQYGKPFLAKTELLMR